MKTAKEVKKLIEEALISAYGDTLTDGGTSKKMASKAFSVLKKNSLLKNIKK